MVTGGIDPGVLDDLVGLCLTYAGHGPHCGAAAGHCEDPDSADRTGQPGDPPGDPGPAADPPGGDDPRPPGSRAPSRPRPPTAQAQEMLRHAIIGKAVNLVSGPGGLASFLRTRLAGARQAGPSLPLDVGHSDQIPAAIRRAVILRDQHCRWAGAAWPVRGTTGLWG